MRRSTPFARPMCRNMLPKASSSLGCFAPPAAEEGASSSSRLSGGDVVACRQVTCHHASHLTVAHHPQRRGVATHLSHFVGCRGLLDEACSPAKAMALSLVKAGKLACCLLHDALRGQCSVCIALGQ